MWEWDLVLDTDLDCCCYKIVYNPNAREKVREFLQDEEYIDAWRVCNEDKRVILGENLTLK